MSVSRSSRLFWGQKEGAGILLHFIPFPPLHALLSLEYHTYGREERGMLATSCWFCCQSRFVRVIICMEHVGTEGAKQYLVDFASILLERSLKKYDKDL